MSFREFFVKYMMPKVDWKQVLRILLYLFLSLLVQTMLLSRLRIAGICPFALPAAAVAVGMFEGPVWGVLYSLLLGIFADMAFVENTVLFAVVFPLLAFATGFVSQFFINRRFFAFMGAAAVGLRPAASHLRRGRLFLRHDRHHAPAGPLGPAAGRSGLYPAGPLEPVRAGLQEREELGTEMPLSPLRGQLPSAGEPARKGLE